MSLGKTQIKKWSDMVTTFTKRYKLNLELTLDRISLQEIEKRADEIVREYAQRSQGLVIQVNPHLIEKEMIFIFMNAFKDPYFGYMVCNTLK